jgi:hypothetical protein
VAQYATRVARLPLRQSRLLKVYGRCTSCGPQVSPRHAAARAVVRASRIISVKRVLKCRQGRSIRTGKKSLLRRKHKTGVESETDMKNSGLWVEKVRLWSRDEQKKERTMGEQSDQTAKPYMQRNRKSQKSDKK